MNPQFPIYIVSKGRADSRYTSKSLERIGVPYRIVVESQERDAYAAVIDPEKILVLDPSFHRDYDTFDDLGESKSKGPGAARNFAWAHSMSEGFMWHWVMDDNISGFFRFQHNMRIQVGDGTIFKAMEEWCIRFRNVAMAGPDYFYFNKRKMPAPTPYVLNTRIYSCNLIRNDVPFRWRGRYNEDTDLSLRMLKLGWCTASFLAFLQYKIPTQVLSGGNTAAFYASEGTRPKSEMLYRMHPDVTRLVHKFGRDHHQVDYSGFKKNRLVLRPGVEIPEGVDNYGMVLRQKPLVAR